MAIKLYKTTVLAIVATLIVSFGGFAQTTKAEEKDKEAKEKEVKELRAKQQELRTKQQQLNKELLEVNKKLSADQRNGLFTMKYDSSLFKVLKGHNAYTLNLRYDSLYLKELKDVKAYKLDSGMLKALTQHKLAALDYSKHAQLFSKDIKKYAENMAVIGEKFAKEFDGKKFTIDGFSNTFNFNSNDPNYKGIEKSKTISRSYPVSSKDKLSVNNQYGTVTINTWNKSEVKVDVEVKAYDSSDDGAQKLLDAVKIEDSKGTDLVSFKTVIERSNNTSWWSRTINGKTERRGVQVNYVVFMPAKSSLDVSNSYGAVIVPDMDGVLKTNISYGSLKGGRLSNPANVIKANYSPVTIESIEGGSLSIQYNKADIGTAKDVNMNLSYSNNSRIGQLINGGDLKLTYSVGFKIEQLADQFKVVNVTSTYSPKFTINAGASNFDFDVSVSYANFSYDNSSKVNVQNREPAGTSGYYNMSKNYKGQYGKGSDSKVVIKSAYGSVQFL